MMLGEQHEIGEAQVCEQAPGDNKTLQMIDLRIGEIGVFAGEVCEACHGM